ncbi:MAG: SPOR domain-containing protein [Gammaproteobacteria bacterium]|nr:SPOR domain-containing protein [Gammaproteobacteria bacterium]
MSRDYKHAEVFSPGTRPMPFWMWLFAAAAISGFASLIYYLDQYERAKTLAQPANAFDVKPAESKNSLTQVQPQTPAQTKSADENKSSFDFYKLLPNLSVDVAKTEPAQPRESASSATEPAESSAPFSYILQAGSFKDFQEADRLKAGLALIGIKANIEKVILNQSEVWHRVRIGPLLSEREMNKIRSRLQAENIEPIILKVKS